MKFLKVLRKMSFLDNVFATSTKMDIKNDLIRIPTLGLKPLLDLGIDSNSSSNNSNRSNNNPFSYSEKNEWEPIEIPPDLPIIYQKQLDSNLCTAFESEKGQKLFKEAISTDYMNIYYTLSPQFCTQQHPNFCGVSALVMILNGLRVDPGRMWKYPWRWYDEKMLNTCIPMKKVEAQGIDITCLMCLAHLNKLAVTGIRASKLLTLQQFRHDLETTCSSYDTVMLLNYSRQAFRQTGTGHFAAVGGYHKADGKLLLMDTARFKYPPHWVSVDKMLQALQEIAVAGDGKTDDMPRGYMMLRKSNASNITIKVNETFKMTFDQKNTDILRAVSYWRNWLRQKYTKKDFLSIAIFNLAERLNSVNVPLIFDTKITEAINSLEIERTRLYHVLEKLISNHSFLQGLLSKKELVDILVVIILFWPYRANKEDKTRGQQLQEFVAKDLRLFDTRYTLTLQEQIHFIEELAEHADHKKWFVQPETHTE